MSSVVTVPVQSLVLPSHACPLLLQCPFSHWFYRLIVVLNFITFLLFRFGCLLVIYWGMFTMHQRFSPVYLVCLFLSIVAVTIINSVLLWRVVKVDVLGRYSGHSKPNVVAAVNTSVDKSMRKGKVGAVMNNNVNGTQDMVRSQHQDVVRSQQNGTQHLHTE